MQIYTDIGVKGENLSRIKLFFFFMRYYFTFAGINFHHTKFSQMSKAIIIDDEKESIYILQVLLNTYCPEIAVVATCASGNEGIQAIQIHQPHLVFLDIEMPQMNGFSMLEKLGEYSFEVIFVTAYNQYAIKAFKFSAFDYLLKPIDAEDLLKTVQKWKNKKANPNPLEQFQHLLQSLKNPISSIQKMVIPTADGFQFVKIDDIIRLETAGNFTVFHLNGKTQLISTQILKEWEDTLQNHSFFRIHNSHIINLQYIKKYIKGDNGQVIMEDGTSLDISRRRKEEFLAKMLQFK